MGIIGYNESRFKLGVETRLKNAELVKARKSTGLSIKEAAKRMNLSPMSLFNYENLRAYPEPENQKKVCKFYKKEGYFITKESVFPKVLLEIIDLQRIGYVPKSEIPQEKLVSLDSVKEEELPHYATKQRIKDNFLVEELSKAASTLTPREANVLKYRFGLNDGKPHTLGETGTLFNVTKERIRVIEAKALRKLRHPASSRKLQEFI